MRRPLHISNGQRGTEALERLVQVGQQRNKRTSKPPLDRNIGSLRRTERAKSERWATALLGIRAVNDSTRLATMIAFFRFQFRYGNLSNLLTFSE